MDWFVVLTPLLVLGVIALLGFTGCDLVFVVDPPVAALSLQIRVPSQFTVDDAAFRFTQPNSNTLETTTGLDRTDDGSGIAVLSHLVASAAKGSWSVECRIQVTDATRQATATTTGEFTLDEDTDFARAVFETSGAPATNDFQVAFTGLVSGN